ncbi:hypothetical protein GSI_05579 [Ganoderma sinense ZZ0214-1]|uniref:DUF6534 domain-containing protein n=1 Tax=Ganoderma sinense ZZ0214-1 TaxID=1077348 RepID=A0A2G8SF02_9APHY|nr:hypothetical protein GSI_05579 [Ganoderma sinense ZZ0214-1]
MTTASDSMDFTIGNTYGALLLGTFFSLVLYGIVLHQTYRYLRLHPHDYAYIQVLVAVSLILETFHAVCIMHLCYHALVTNYANANATLEGSVPWSSKFFVLTGELSQIAAYLFFVRRLYFSGDLPFSRSFDSHAHYRHRFQYTVFGTFKLVVALVTLFLATSVGFGLAITVEFFRSQNPATFLESVNRNKIAAWQYLVHGKFASAAATHVLLTGSLIYALYRGQKVRSEQKGVVDWCMLFIVNTGILVGIFDITAWISASAAPNSAWWAALYIVTVKVYMVTFLSVLNSRRLLTKDGIEIFGTDSAMRTERNLIARAQRFAAAERYNAPQLPDSAPTRIDIKVATEIEGGDGVKTSHSSVIIEERKVVGV